MPTAPPSLGYGQRGAAPINAVNAWMRSTPWYQQKLASWGQNPNSVHLSDWQKQDLIKTAQANGVVVDEGHDGQQIDDAGNFEAKGHGLRNTLIVAGIAAAALATAGAAGVFGGAAAGGGAASAGAGAGAALGPSTAANLAATAGIVGGGSVPASLAAVGGGAGTLGSLAGVGKFLASPGGSTLASTLAGSFANIYGANKQADAARYGVDQQTAAANHAADLQDAAAQRAEAFTRQQAQAGFQSDESNRHANYDQWSARQHAIMGSLGQSLGINYAVPDYVPGVDPHYLDNGAAPAKSVGSGQTPAAAASGAAPTQFIKSLLDQGIDPQAAIQQTNDKFKLGTGSQAVYYDPSQHGGVATIGLPDSYLALTNGKWDVTQRTGTAPKNRPLTLGGLVSSTPFLPVSPSAMPTPYQPGTIGAYLAGRTR